MSVSNTAAISAMPQQVVFPAQIGDLSVERIELRHGQQGCLLDSVQIVEIMWMGAVLKPASQRFSTLSVSSTSATGGQVELRARDSQKTGGRK